LVQLPLPPLKVLQITPDPCSDLKALERFPFAGAANSYLEADARQRFVNRVRDDTALPYGILREVAGGAR